MNIKEKQITSALNLMRRMPPAQIENNLSGLLTLIPEDTDELLQRIDQPLQVRKDPKTGKSFVLCDYNRDGDSYRSPWCNEYFPAIDDGFMPSGKLRQMEVEANEVFDIYRQLYFEGGYSSVYFWDINDTDFASCWLIQKDIKNIRGLDEGSWNSIHVIECVSKEGGKAEYKLTTTVIVSMKVKSNAALGYIDLSGNMTKQNNKTIVLDADHQHVGNMGRMIEETEQTIRNEIEGIYIQKTKEVLSGMRSLQGTQVIKQQAQLAGSLKAKLESKAQE